MASNQLKKNLLAFPDSDLDNSHISHLEFLKGKEIAVNDSSPDKNKNITCNIGTFWSTYP